MPAILQSSLKINPLFDTGPYFRRMLAITSFFVVLSVLYCFCYALFFNDEPNKDFYSALTCVSKDWLIWLLVMPFLSGFSLRYNMGDTGDRIKLLLLLSCSTLGLGLARISMELTWGNGNVLHTLMIYIPRYLVITSLMLCIGYLMRDHSKSQKNNDHLSETGDSEVNENQLNKTDPQPLRPASQLSVYKGSAVKLLSIEDIRYIRTNGNYLEVQTQKESYLRRGTMKNIEALLGAQGFLRVHRCYMVNQNYIDCACAKKSVLKLTDQTQVPIGKSYIHSIPHFNHSLQ